MQRFITGRAPLRSGRFMRAYVLDKSSFQNGKRTKHVVLGQSASLQALRSFASATDPAQKPSTWEKVKVTLHETWIHLKHGSIQFGRNFGSSRRLLLASWRSGQPLSRRDRRLVVQTAADVLRLIPFAVIVIVPFAEFALPILLKLFPNMLPSTFTSQSQKDNVVQKQLKAKVEVLKFLQDTQSALSSRIKFDSEEDKQQYERILQRIKNGEQVDVKKLEKYADALDEEFDLSRLEWRELRALCKFFSVPSFGTRFMLIEALKLKLKSIRQDDESISKEGLSALNPTELLEAATSRGLQLSSAASETDSITRARAYLNDWLEFSKAKVPIYLHLLLRSLDADGVLSNVNASTTTAVADEKRALVPDLVEISLTHAAQKQTKASDSASDQLQSKIQAMLKELESTVGVAVKTDVSAEATAAPVVSGGLTPAALICTKTVFSAFDSNGDQHISRDEFKQSMAVLGLTLSDSDVDGMLRKFDANQSGRLSVTEFSSLVASINSGKLAL